MQFFKEGFWLFGAKKSMKQKFIAALFLPLATVAFAGKEYISQAELMKDMPEVFTSVNIVPDEKMDYHEPQNTRALHVHQIRTMGYVESSTTVKSAWTGIT